MMKKIYNSFHLMAVLALLLSTAVASCDRDEMGAAEGDGTIQISLQGVETRAGALFDGDAEITKLRVIVCNGGAVEITKLFTAGDTVSLNTFELRVTTGTKTVYVVANEKKTLTPSLSTVVSKTALDALLADQIADALDLPLVMTGKTADGMVTVTANEINKTKVSLKRIAARIKLQFMKDTDKDVVVTKVSLLHNTGMTPLFEGGATVTPQTYWDYEYSLANNLTLTDALQTIKTGDEDDDVYVYLYENLAALNDDDHPDNANAVQLQVEALFNNIPTTYRVYINENIEKTTTPPVSGDPQSSETTRDDHLYSLKRNYSYELTGTITKMGETDGLVLTANVLPWNQITTEVDYVLWYEIFPTVYDDDYEYEVDTPTDDQEFTFKLLRPLNSSWKAHLTNPVAFSFVIGLNPDDPDDDYEYVDSGITEPNDDGLSAYSMKIKPNQVQDDKQRSTEFYIIVNGKEIPLISGSNKTGPGNRPVIYQPSKKP